MSTIILKTAKDVLAEIKETNRLLKQIIINQNVVKISAISESEFQARKWDNQDGYPMEQSQPEKEPFEAFQKRMLEGIGKEIDGQYTGNKLGDFSPMKIELCQLVGTYEKLSDLAKQIITPEQFRIIKSLL